MRALGAVYGPYTGRCFASTRESDIEHVVAASEAHDSGLCAADAETKARFSRDLRNLTLASPKVNRTQKSGKDAAEWIPHRNRCWFAARVVEVRQAYGLTIDRREAAALERILSGSVRLAPGDRRRGLSFSLAPTYGAASSGVSRLWSARDAQGLAPDGEYEARQRLEGELGYGLSVFGERFTGTPNLGFGFSDRARDYRIGWRLTSAVRGDPGFEFNLDATRRESANDNELGARAEHGVILRAAIRW